MNTPQHRYRFSAKTHVGKKRKINEDAVLVLPDQQIRSADIFVDDEVAGIRQLFVPRSHLPDLEPHLLLFGGEEIGAGIAIGGDRRCAQITPTVFGDAGGYHAGFAGEQFGNAWARTTCRISFAHASGIPMAWARLRCTACSAISFAPSTTWKLSGAVFRLA